MPDAPAVLADLPADVAGRLTDFVAAARDAFGDRLESVVLYGSAAEAALRATSDVNVILVLSAFDRERADRLRAPLRIAHGAIRLRAMFLLAGEVADAAEAFAQKFDDVAHRRRVLWGRDPFAGLAVSRQALVRRVDQVLLNLTLRMRALYVRRGEREEQLAYLVADLAGPLRTSAQSLLELEGRAAASPKEALGTLAAALPGDWAPVLARLSEAREQRTLPPGVAGPTLCRLIELAEAMRARVRALPPA